MSDMVPMNPTPEDKSNGEREIIDPEVVASLRELAPEDEPGFVRELIDAYRDDAVVHLAGIKESLKSNDAEGLRKAAHTLKSSSANVGAVQVSRLALEIETLARAGTPGPAAGLAAQLDAEFARALNAWDRILG